MNALKSIFLGAACATALGVTAAQAAIFDVPGGDLESALNAFAAQSSVQIVVSSDAIRGVRTRGAKGDLAPQVALSKILAGTGFTSLRDPAGALSIVRGEERPQSAAPVRADDAAPVQLAAAAAASVETIVVTSSKIKGDIQTVPIAITALSQEQLTQRQIAGGPDLVKEVPNLTFTKTNFTGYSIQIRGIGTQAVSVTTDPAVAVAFNDIPFLRNHFFEQEFYDVGQVEVLRGPQGTLYGRNATAGVVNVVSAKPTDQYEAMLSADWGNYSNRRYEGMVNIPIWSDKIDLRVAGEWTKRDGYTYDSTLHSPVDGRDLWSGRVSVLLHPIENLTATAIWEHFQEDDDRLRSAKTLCTTDPGPSSLDGPDGLITNIDVGGRAWMSQGCKPGSLYAKAAFGIPNPGAIPFIGADEYYYGQMYPGFNPYGTGVQSPNLRVIGSPLMPHYMAKNDTLEFNADYAITPSLTLTSQTGYNKDILNSTEDYNRFNTVPGAFIPITDPLSYGNWSVGGDGQLCDPQLGCSDRFVAEDMSREHAQQFYQELRLASSYSGPLNFSVGASYMRYRTVEDYFVFANAITLLQLYFNGAYIDKFYPNRPSHVDLDPTQLNPCDPEPADPNDPSLSFFGTGCGYVDPNPISHLDGQGHNYFRSQNPYRLNSWAGFGEVYYQVTPDVKLTGGLRWTDDKKSFDEIPSWALFVGKGFVTTGILNQQWKEWTGRFNATWTPKLDFTDQSMFYGSYARGYKGGGANPPGVIPIFFESPSNETHPLTFRPEFVNAYEIGTKNTLLDGALTLDSDVFYYDYKDYQISQIVDRTAVNLNFNATVKGAEMEATWEPVPGLRFNFAGGYEDTRVGKGQKAIDLMDRTAGKPGWMVIKPFVSQTSNCIMPTAIVNQILSVYRAELGGDNATSAGGDPNVDPQQFQFNNDAGAVIFSCVAAYSLLIDPGQIFDGIDTGYDTSADPSILQETNNGAGFDKNLGGKQLPNAPHFTTSLGAQYTMPLSDDWAGTLRGDFYWQSQSYARIFNDKPYDKLRGYSTTNLAMVFTNADGWEVMGYVKNVFNATAITGAFLNSDDTALTTNVFTTDPRLYGVRVTKSF